MRFQNPELLIIFLLLTAAVYLATGFWLKRYYDAFIKFSAMQNLKGANAGVKARHRRSAGRPGSRGAVFSYPSGRTCSRSPPAIANERQGGRGQPARAPDAGAFRRAAAGSSGRTNLGSAVSEAFACFRTRPGHSYNPGASWPKPGRAGY